MSTLSKNKKHAKRSGKKMLLIFNPVSGKSQIRTDLVDIVQILSDKDYLVTCYPTKCKGDARDMVMHRPDDYDVVVCAGGDGTVDEVVSGMMDSTDKPLVPMGYIPCGTTNDFAASLGISSDMKQAAKAVANGKPVKFDLGLFNKDTYFTYVAAFGVFTEASYQTPQDLKNQFGHAAYVLQGRIDLGRIRTYHFRVESDEVSVEDDFVFGMITNSKSVGGFPDITGRSVDMSDGLFEVTLIKMPANFLELNDIVQYLNHTSDSSELVFRFKTSKITLQSSEPVNWTRDGEFGGSFDKVEIANLHHALEIIVPRGRESASRAGDPRTP